MNRKKLISNFNIFKKSKGSIAIIVLIIGIAVVLAVGALSAYMIKDIKFTQLDEQKLKALNIAEAGISDMYSNLDLFYNGDVNGVKAPLKPLLLVEEQPTEGVVYSYNGEVTDNTGVLGTYHIEYKLEDSSYTINSIGTDSKSQVKRKVAVKINVSGGGSSFDIYDYIYSGDPVKISGSGDIDLSGTIFINADLDIAGTGEQNIGNIIVRGDLTISGDSTTISGPIYVGGDFIVNGGIIIGSDYENPLIVVMGNLIKNGASGTIGTPDKLIEIYCGGSISGTPIYYFPSENEYTFDYPEFNVSDYIDEFKNEIDSTSSKYVLNSLLILDKANADSGYTIGNADN